MNTGTYHPVNGPSDNLVLTTWCGESATVYYVVDADAPDGEQPAVIASFRRRADLDAAYPRFAEPDPGPVVITAVLHSDGRIIRTR